ncbi:hypothetical protein, partial [Streptomyces wedmorensis]|uniref:hypothetical protein n=1 Tax=Streptomyces wedmorensis TaxID=43759 RepID=UPI00379E390C
EADLVSVPRAEGVVVPESVVPVPPNVADPHLVLTQAVAEGSPVGQWADYVVARTVHDRRNGTPYILGEILRSLRIDQKSRQSLFVIGVLEAAGVFGPHPMRVGATYDQMRQAVGVVADKLKAGEPLSLWHVAGAVLSTHYRDRGAWRILGWATGAMLLHPLADGARQRMKDEVVELGRQAEVRGQVPDVEGIARSVFAVEAPTEVTVHQRFLVAGWLSGEEVSWGPVAGTETALEAEASTVPLEEGFPRTGQLVEAEADLVSVPRAEGVVVPESVVPVPPNVADPHLVLAQAVAEGSPVGQWADYIVARTVHDRRNGTPFILAEILRGLRIEQIAHQAGFVIGVLEAAGVLGPHPMRVGATYDQMRQAVGVVAGSLKAGEPLALSRVARAVLGGPRGDRGAWRILGWATGAMLLHPLADGARQRMRDEVVELGRQAEVRGQVPDVEGIARSVFAVEAPTEVTVHQKFLVAGWLSGEEVSWEPVPGVEVTPGPVDPGLEVTPGLVAELEHLLYAAMPLSDIANRLRMSDDEDRAHRFLLEQSARYRADFDTALAEILSNILVRDRDVDAKLGDFAARKGLRVTTVKLWRNHHDDVLLLRHGLRDLSKREREELRSRAMSRLTEPADDERNGALGLLAEERLLRAMWDLREEEMARMIEADMDVVASVPGDESAFALKESQHEDGTVAPVVEADHDDDVMSLDEEISDTQESTVPVTPDTHARAARVLAEYKQRPEASASELVGVAYPGVTEPSLDQVMRTVGFLEAVGAPSIGEVAPIEMVVAVAMMRSRTDSGEEGWTADEVVEEVLGAERNVEGESSRLLGWFEAAGYLDGSDGTSVYGAFVERVVQNGRDLRGADRRVDVREVARLSFAVREPSATQMAAVRYWLAQHDMRFTVDQGESAGAVTQPFSTVDAPVVAVIATLVGGLPSPALQLDENVSLRERAEYVVHRAVLAAVRGPRADLAVLALEAFSQAQSNPNKGMVVGFLEGLGVASLLRSRRATHDRHMAGVFVAARRSLEEGKPVDPVAITTSVLGHVPDMADQYFLGKVTGWLVVAGLMGGPVVKDGVIERIKGALTGAASGVVTGGDSASPEQREQEATQLYSRVFQVPEPSVMQKAVAVEWLAEDPLRVYAR